MLGSAHFNICAVIFFNQSLVLKHNLRQTMPLTLFKINNILGVLRKQRIFGSFNGSKQKMRKVAMDGVDMVKAALNNYLLPSSRLKFGDKYAYSLVAAVIHTIFSESPLDETGRSFIQSEENLDIIHRLIEQEIKPNKEFKQIITDAVRVQYIFYFDLNTESSEQDFLQPQAPINNLNDLGILIPSRETPKLNKFILDATTFMQSSKFQQK